MKITWNLFFLLAAGISQTSIVYADFVGINIDDNYWLQNRTKSLNNYNRSFDLVDDLDNGDKSRSLTIILEHPISVIPNIRYQSTNLNNSALFRGSNNLNVNGSGVTYGDRLPSSFNLSQDDIVFYYELGTNIDLGIDLKRFDGEIEFSDSDSSSVRLDETVPLLYLSAHFDLPYNGFYVGADFNNLSLGDSIIEDSTIKLGYQSGTGLGFEGGYKSFLYEFDNTDNPGANLQYDGIFLNGYFHF